MTGYMKYLKILFIAIFFIVNNNTLAMQCKGNVNVFFPKEDFLGFYNKLVLVFHDKKKLYVYNFMQKKGTLFELDKEIISFNINNKSMVNFVFLDDLSFKFESYDIFSCKRIDSDQCIVEDERKGHNKLFTFQLTAQKFYIAQTSDQSIVVIHSDTKEKEDFYFNKRLLGDEIKVIDNNQIRVTFDDRSFQYCHLKSSSSKKIVDDETEPIESLSLLNQFEKEIAPKDIQSIKRLEDTNIIVASLSNNMIEIYDSLSKKVLYTSSQEIYNSYYMKGATEERDYLKLAGKDKFIQLLCIDKKQNMVYAVANQCMRTLHYGVFKTYDDSILLFNFYKKKQISLDHEAFKNKKISSLSFIKNEQNQEQYVKFTYRDYNNKTIVVLLNLYTNEFSVVSSFCYSHSRNYMACLLFDGTLFLIDMKKNIHLKSSSLALFNKSKSSITKCIIFEDVTSENVYLFVKFGNEEKVLVSVHNNQIFDLIGVPAKSKHYYLFVSKDKSRFLADSTSGMLIPMGQNRKIVGNFSNDNYVCFFVSIDTDDTEKGSTFQVWKLNSIDRLRNIEKLDVAIEKKVSSSLVVWQFDNGVSAIFNFKTKRVLRCIENCIKWFHFRDHIIFKTKSINLYFDLITKELYPILQTKSSHDDSTYLFVVRDPAAEYKKKFILTNKQKGFEMLSFSRAITAKEQLSLDFKDNALILNFNDENLFPVTAVPKVTTADKNVWEIDNLGKDNNVSPISFASFILKDKEGRPIFTISSKYIIDVVKSHTDAVMNLSMPCRFWSKPEIEKAGVSFNTERPFISHTGGNKRKLSNVSTSIDKTTQLQNNASKIPHEPPKKKRKIDIVSFKK